MQAFSGIFSMRSLWDALSFSGHSTPDVNARKCNLGELLHIRDSKSSTESKVESWKKKLATEDFCPHKAHPEGYLQDLERITYQLNGQEFYYLSPDSKDERRRKIDNVILDMVSTLQITLSGTTDGANLIRYFLQDLMSQAIFVIDPEFPAKYNHTTYVKRNLLLMNRDEPDCHKQSHISLSASNSTTLVLQAVQYWKVVDQSNPTIVKGFDAQQVELTIDFTKATRETLLSCFESARCVLSFHGFRKSIDEISY